jgi:hypothetical protein
MEDELYETPGWVTEALVRHLPYKPNCVLEGAPGSGRMVQALAGALGPRTRILSAGPEFLAMTPPLETHVDAIITNPPYGKGGRLAVRFIEKALELTAHDGLVAMLLKVDFDSAATRAHIFEDCPQWAKKVVLRRRIMWFPSETGNGPSDNHAWFIWNWRHEGPPTIVYGPSSGSLVSRVSDHHVRTQGDSV